MNSEVKWFFANQNLMTIKIALSLLVLVTSLILLLNYNNFAFSQLGNETALAPNSENLITSGSPVANQSVGGSQAPSGFVASGKINSVMALPNGKWLATGNWSIILNNGNITAFETKMTWYNSSGTNAHTHELIKLRPAAGNIQTLPMSGPGNQIIIKGVTDVGSNNRVSWYEVPTVITINDRKILSISLDDNKTNHHFGGQPLLGIVDSFVPCSDLPGPNMELLPSCTVSPVGEQGFALTNNTLASSEGSTYGGALLEGGIPPGGFPLGDEQSAGGRIPPGGLPPGGLPPTDEQSAGGGIPPGGLPPTDEQSAGGGIPPGALPPTDEQSAGGGIPPGGLPPTDEQSAGGGIPPTDEKNGGGAMDTRCIELKIENITANGFETDPSDYHPPTEAIDGSSSTWWSYNGKNPWIEISLHEPQSICGLSVQWNKGDERKYSFEISVSEDGNNFEKVFEGSNKKGSTEQEIYPFEGKNGKFVKLTITSTSSKDGWASIQEINVFGFPNGNNQTGGGGIPPVDNQTGGPIDNQTGGGGIPPGGIPPVDNQTGGGGMPPVDNQTGGPIDNQTGGGGIPPGGIPPGGIPPIDNLTEGGGNPPIHNKTDGLKGIGNLTLQESS